MRQHRNYLLGGTALVTLAIRCERVFLVTTASERRSLERKREEALAFAKADWEYQNANYESNLSEALDAL